ncbi:S-layer homology domain-containing protein [Sporosarcina sp. Te-1]|uniref:S-layer homology domain-containing protein n=1 Tax=Sporosarcina sp. Te-1 TaxID=2818390 RepID=UPI001A9F8566|nr:S-layer homology domain-containing protein [Sporosarcina sp. Te-1]QTD40806.1 S-layer homology domain-containing protein [Sporosarcina sp. Te-1]
MGELHKKYRKFITTAASAALVASAVAPVASAKDFSDTKGNTHEAAIDALSDAGVISGYPDGTFQPNKTLTRSDVVKLMGKWLVSEGHAVPTDYKTNPRFADLTSSSNDELLKYAAVVKDNGVFVGTPDGKLDPAGNITRENMAIVLVRAFDRVNDIDLAAYVARQDFKKDVTDLGSAKAEARPAIDVLDFFDITNPAAPAFNPKNTTTRGHFATFLHKFTNADFSAVSTGVVGKGAVKAVNATTVEVTFKDAVENVNSLNFTIDGLTVSNAAVKQSDDKTVVLTTAVQEGGKKYTVSLDNKGIGTFVGISSVIPTKINITTQSVQGKVGQQAIVSADVGVKKAGIPVTFNVKANTTGTLNKDQVFEAITDQNGIATFSYTQYAAGTDEVVAYPTGAPTVRSHAFVFWGVDTILTIAPTDEKGNSVNNGADKTYKLTYLDPKTGKPVANQKFFVTFEENLNVNVDKTSKATVNGVNPRQLLNNADPEVAEVTTDAKGEAVFVVSGSNTAVTPIVFIDNGGSNTAKYVREKYEANKLQAKMEKLSFVASQAAYSIDIFGLLGENPEAAVGYENGREFTAMVMDENGEPVANEYVNFAFNEDIDRNIKTETEAQFIDWLDGGQPKKQISYKTNEFGEVEFTIASEKLDDYATVLAWIDTNSPDAVDSNLDEGEPFQLGPITYFAKEKLSVGSLFVTDGNGAVPRPEKKVFKGNEIARVDYYASNQSFFPMDLPEEYSHIDATFTITNTGGEDVIVTYTTNKGVTQTQIIKSNRSYTTLTISAFEPSISIESIDNKTASVNVLANGTAIPADNQRNVSPINLGSSTAKVEFVSTKEVGTEHVGIVTSFNKDTKKITFAGKNALSYSGKIATFFDETTGFSKALTETEFANKLGDDTKVSNVRLLINGDNYKFILTSQPAKGAAVIVSSAQANDVDGDGVADSVELTFSKAVNANILKSSDFNFVGGVVKAQAIEKVTGDDAKVTIKIIGASGLAVPVLEYSSVSYLAADYGDLKANSVVVTAATETTLLAAAKSAVTSAETLKTQAAVETAQGLIDGLPSSNAKTELQTRINVVKAGLGEGEAQVKAAELAVTAAEQLNTQAAYDDANAKVTALPNGSAKSGLEARLVDVKGQVDVNAEAAKFGDFAPTAATAGTVSLPSVSGYTFKVKSTSTPAVYDTDGKILTDGTSNVVYTITHDTTGKTADTAEVKVTVDVL